jgi:hypothetical protein
MNHQWDIAASRGRQVLCELIETELVSCHVPVQGLQRRSLHNCDCHQSAEDGLMLSKTLMQRIRIRTSYFLGKV